MGVRAVTTVICAAALTALLAGVADADARQTGRGDELLGNRDWAGAIAAYRAVAEAPQPLHLLAWRSRDAAAAREDQALASWAAALPADAGVALLRARGTPAAQRQLAGLLVAAAAAAHARHDDIGALARLDELQVVIPAFATLDPTLGAAVAAAQPGYELGAARALLGSRGADAVTLLDDVVAVAPAAVAAQAQALLPSALLAAGRQAIAAGDAGEAAALLHRLAALHAPEAATARALLAAPEVVVGTLVRKDGSPVSGPVRISSSFRAVGDAYETSPPFYAGTADGNGDFRIAGVAAGGPYVLEVEGPGGWTTLIDPATGRPAVPVTVVALHATDLGFVVLPG